VNVLVGGPCGELSSLRIRFGDGSKEAGEAASGLPVSRRSRCDGRILARLNEYGKYAAPFKTGEVSARRSSGERCLSW
jgi:hypothetical protein